MSSDTHQSNINIDHRHAPRNTNDSGSESTSTSIEEGFTVEWTTDEIEQLLKTHYGYLLAPPPPPSSGSDSASQSNYQITCKEPPKGMENHSIQITIVHLRSNGNNDDDGDDDTSVVLSKTKVMLRIYGDEHKSREFIAFELDTMYKLRQCLSFPVPRIVETARFMDTRQDIRDCIIVFKEHLAVVFEYCEGYHMPSRNKNVDYIRAIAQFSGYLHRYTKQYDNFDAKRAYFESVSNSSGDSSDSGGSNESDAGKVQKQNQNQSYPYLLIDERFQVQVGRVHIDRLTFEYFWEEMNKLFASFMENGTSNSTEHHEVVPSVSTSKALPIASTFDEQAKRLIRAMYDLCHQHLKRYSVEEQDALEQQLPRSLVHGDAHTSNVLFTADPTSGKPVVSAVLDWDDCFIGPCVVDLVQCLYFWCMRPSHDESDGQMSRVINLDYLRAYMSSYTESRDLPLTDLEKSYLFDYLYLVLVSNIHYLLTNSDIGLAPPVSTELEEQEMFIREMLGYFIQSGLQFETLRSKLSL